MSVILIPFILTIFPYLGLFLIDRNSSILKNSSKIYKAITAFLFIAVNTSISFYATIISINGMKENGIRCVTGAILFVGLGFCLTFLGGRLIYNSY
jgi:hypothetical protein